MDYLLCEIILCFTSVCCCEVAYARCILVMCEIYHKVLRKTDSQSKKSQRMMGYEAKHQKSKELLRQATTIIPAGERFWCTLDWSQDSVRNTMHFAETSLIVALSAERQIRNYSVLEICTRFMKRKEISGLMICQDGAIDDTFQQQKQRRNARRKPKSIIRKVMLVNFVLYF